MANKTNKKLCEEIIKLRKAGFSYGKISKMLDISPQLAHYHGKKGKLDKDTISK